MSYTNSNEQSFVLGDIQLFREFDMNNFISTARSFITESYQEMKPIDISFYSESVTKALNELKSKHINAKEIMESVKDFSTNYSKSINDISFDVSLIRPKYLTEYVKNAGLTFERVLDGSLTKEEIGRYVSEDVAEKVKRQMVRSSLSYVGTSRNVYESASNKTVSLTKDFITTSVIPFLENADNTINQVVKESEDTIDSLNEANKSLNSYITVINNIMQNPDIGDAEKKDLKYVAYNVIRTLLEVSSFLAQATIRKISNVNTAISTSSEVNNVVSQNSTLTTESFTDTIVAVDTNSLADGLLKGESGAYSVVAKSIIGFSDCVRVNPLEDTTDGCNYNKNIYEDVNKAYIIISNGLDLISRNCDDYLLVFDDIINKSGFTVGLPERFKELTESINDISEYSSANLLPTQTPQILLSRMLCEVKDFSSNMETLAANIRDCRIKMEDLKKRFESNVNGEFENSEAMNELKVFMDELKDQYRVLTVNVAGGFMQRLKKLGFELDKACGETEIKESEAYDLDLDSMLFESLVEQEDAFTDVLFEAMSEAYVIARREKERGVKVVVEAPTQQNNQQPQQPQQTQNNSTLQNAVGKGGKVVQSVTQKIEEWFNQFVEKINKLIKSNQAKADAQYFANHKQELLNKNFSNASNKTPIIEYEKLCPYNKILADTRALSNKTASSNLTPQKLQNIKEQKDIVKIIFANNPPASVFESDNIPQAITQYYKSGTYSENPVTVRSGELKAMVTNAVNFCEPFYTKFLPQLQKNIEQVKNNLTQVLTSLVKENTIDDFIGNLFVEAPAQQPQQTTNAQTAQPTQNAQQTQQTTTQTNNNQQQNNQNNNQQQQNNQNNNNQQQNTQQQKQNTTQNANTVTNMSNQGSQIQRLVQQYCNAVMTATFDRYKDYMILLHSIIPDNGVQPQQQAQQPQQNQQKK